MKTLNESNFVIYAATNYINMQCFDTEEFYCDLSRYKYLKKLFYRYHEKGELKERLILNHLITLYNVFEHSANTRMLFFRTNEEHWYILKTFLAYLEYLPETIRGIGDHGYIDTNKVSVDFKIAKILREL